MEYVTDIHCNEGKAPEWIMFMPEGEHTIYALRDNKPRLNTVIVNESCISALQSALDEKLAAGLKPCVYFDHQRGAAAAYPDRFEYGQAADGKKGVLLHIKQWSARGRAAVEGSDYNGFSPLFRVDENGEPCGLDVGTAEVGSLTNEPAFRAISRIAASTPDEPTQPSTKHNKMNKYLIDKLGLPADASEDVIKEALEKRFAASERKEPAATDEGGKSDTDAEKDARIEALEKQLEEEKQKNAKLHGNMADSVIKAAVAEGKIAPKNEKGIAAIKAAYMADPENTMDIIAAMQANPALTPTETIERTVKVTKRSVADDYAEELNK